MNKNILIPVILIILSLLMLTIFNQQLQKIDQEVFDFVSALMLGVGIGMIIKIILPYKKKTE